MKATHPCPLLCLVGRSPVAAWLVLAIALVSGARADTLRTDGLEGVAVEAAAVRFEVHASLAGITLAEDSTLVVEDGILPNGPAGPRATLPGTTAWVALPPGTRPSIRVEAIESRPIAWPEGLGTAQREALRRTTQPEGWGTEGPSWMRDQWVVGIRFTPLTVGADGGLRYVTRFACRVAHPGVATEPARPTPGRDPFEGIYRSLLANYEQGRAWRRGVSSARPRADREDGFGSSPNPWVRIEVSRRGPMLVLGSDLEEAGLSLEAIDPLSLRLFRPPSLPLAENLDVTQSPAWMAEIPIELLDLDADGILDPQDGVRFFGQPADGWYDELGASTLGPDRHFRDPYDGRVFYWLTWGGSFAGAPKRMVSVDGSAAAEPYVTTVIDRVHFERDLFWEPRPRDYLVAADRAAAWERFWWESFTAQRDEPEKVVVVAPPDPVVDRPARVRVRLWGNYVDRGTAWPDHAIRIALNGTRIIETDRLADGSWWQLFTVRDVDTTGIFLETGSQEFRFQVPYAPLQYPDTSRVDNILLAWIEFDYTRRLIARGDTIQFEAGGDLARTPRSLEISGFTANDLLVYDVSDPFEPRRILPRIEASGGGQVARFLSEPAGEGPARYVAWSAARAIRPSLALRERPAGGWLRERRDAVQMIIITAEPFLDAAERLADFRRERLPGAPGQPDRTPASVAVVTQQEIFDEFSFGRTDPTATRNFLQFARAEWTGGEPEDGPAFVLFFGDAHYDYRDHLGQSAPNHVVTYEGYWDSSLLSQTYSPQFASDDYFGFLDGDRVLDLYLGRIPVRTAADALRMAGKVTAYEQNAARDSWRGRVTLVADDLCQGTRPDALGAGHMRQTEYLPPLIPEALQIDRIYLYEYGADCAYDRKPAAAAALQSRMEEGTLLVNFTGHGSDEQIADERVFEISSVSSLRNDDRLFLFFTASCSVGRYDFFGDGLGEAMLLHDGGGAIAVVSAAAIAYSAGNSEMNQKFFGALWPGRDAYDPRPLGEAMTAGKAAMAQPGNLNSRRYVLLGDPATRLDQPRQPLALSLWSARDGTALGDTLQRGLLSDLEGTVLTEDGLPDATFDGEANVRIYDSAVQRTVSVVSYGLAGAPIYRGQAKVADGTFRLRFQTPSALRTGIRGPAQIYAYVSGGGRDAGGSMPRLAVPETAAQPSADDKGPAILVRFDGVLAGTGEPVAVVAGQDYLVTLADSSGINVTELVPSRSVIAQVEEGSAVVRAEDVAAKVQFGEDYRTATFEHLLPSDLAAGRSYELVVRASDNLANSSSVRIPLIVGGSSARFELAEVFAFPNPAEEEMAFYGRISADADLEIRIYTVTGRRIARVEARGVSPGTLAEDGVPWDGRDQDGDRLANGVYLYRLIARPVDGGPEETWDGRLVMSR